MKNVAVMLGLLLGGFGAARLGGLDPIQAGRVGIAAVFGFTAIGHFVKREAMAAMLPPSIPGRPALILVSGVLEALLAALVLFPAYARAAGIALGVFLVLVTPSNIYAAMKRVDFGGHSAGPRYLFVRLPLQARLLFWLYWFAVRAA
ncbi:MAG TPA: hypothetical protein VFJ90_06000 [Candidatus Didemnitutus sp.]|nr:hypothetical protein [Candidatus Didemnitutus sp.]